MHYAGGLVVHPFLYSAWRLPSDRDSNQGASPATVMRVRLANDAPLRVHCFIAQEQQQYLMVWLQSSRPSNRCGSSPDQSR